jgi:sugar lactone lactonase YvrE
MGAAVAGQPIPKSLYSLLLVIFFFQAAQVRASDPLHTAINGPCQMAFDTAGNLYVNEEYGNRILRIDWKKKDVEVAAGNGKQCCFKENAQAQHVSIYRVYSLALDPQGNLYVGGGNKTDGTFVRMVDHSTGRIRSLANGREPISPDGVPALDADLSDPLGMVAFRNGSLFVSASTFYEIVELEEDAVTSAGNRHKGFSGDGGPALDASFDWPASLALDAGEKLFVADTHNHRIRRIDLKTREITTVAGNGTRIPSGDGGPAVRAGIGDLLDIAADAQGNVFLIESIAFTVRRVDVGTGLISVYAGTGFEGYSGDGGSATSAKIDACGIALDHAGNLYMADKVHNRIRRVDTRTGIITTVAGNGRPRRRVVK